MSFQTRVFDWIKKCFSSDVVNNAKERNYRFLEEALELVQACDLSKEEALQLVDYVYNRPKGEPVQEVGGVAVTLACLCEVKGIDMLKAGEDELSRIDQEEIIKLIREKQNSKPHEMKASTGNMFNSKVVAYHNDIGDGCGGCWGDVVSFDVGKDEIDIVTGEAKLKQTYKLSECKIGIV